MSGGSDPTTPARKGKGGRPPRSPGEKLEQFSIRLTPKLKYGLELLSKSQGRSLSQVVEWAIQRGMNAAEVGNRKKTLGEIVDHVWGQSEWERIKLIQRFAPELLDYFERSIYVAVTESSELRYLGESVETEVVKLQKMHAMTPAADRDNLPRATEALRSRLWYSIDRFVELHWDAIRQGVRSIEEQGKSLKGMSICSVITGVGQNSLGSVAKLEEYLLKNGATTWENRDRSRGVFGL